MERLKIEELADIIFDRFSTEELKKYDELVFGEVLTVKDRFIGWCSKYWKYAKYSKEETEDRLKKIFEKSFFYKNNKFDFSIFDEVMGDFFESTDKETTKTL